MKLLGTTGLAFHMAMGLMLAARVSAADLSLRVTSEPSEVVANGALSYSLALTNIAGFTLTNIAVVNNFSGPALFVSGANNAGSISNRVGSVTFHISSLTNNGTAALSLTMRPTSAGFFTNAITATSTNGQPTSTNVVTQVSTARSDLTAGVTLPSQEILLDDWFVYSVGATNLGPDAAPVVVLSHSLPAGWTLLGVNPSNQNVVATSSNVTINVGTLANQASAQFQIRAQAASAGLVDLSASVAAAGLMDTNAANNATTNMLTVATPGLPLEPTIVTTQTYNPQTGLMNQTVRVNNTNATDVTAARLIVAGLTNRLFSAVGTNNSNPFVLIGATLPAGQTVDLVLEVFNPSRVPAPDPILTSYGVSLPDLTTVSNSGPAIVLMTNLAPNRILLEFLSVPGRQYTIIYSDNPDLTNALAAQPPVPAVANRTQWIDEGPPKTSSSPASVPMRYYRVVELPP